MRQDLLRGDYSFLKDIDFSHKKPDEIVKLAPEAPYFFSYILNQKEYEELLIPVLAAGWQKGTSKWRPFCGDELAKVFLRVKRYEEALTLAESILSKYPQYSGISSVKTSLAESLYRLEKDEELLAMEPLIETEMNPEWLLFKGIALLRLGRDEWRIVFRELFLNYETSAIHNRVIQYFRFRELLDQLPDYDRRLFLAKEALYAGKASEGVALLEALLKDVPSFRSRIVMRELGFAYLNAGLFLRGAPFIQELVAQFPSTGEPGTTALEMAGRLYRKARNYKTAGELFFRAHRESSEVKQRDRNLWFYLDCVQSEEPRDFFETLIRFSGEWDSPDYFSDLIDKEITSLVAARRWQDLVHFYEGLSDRAPEDARGRLGYILSRLVQIKFLTPADFDKNSLLPIFLTGSRISYYNIMTSYIYGNKPAFLDGLYSQETEGSEGRNLSPEDELASGFFRYGLLAEGEAFVRKNLALLSKESVIKGCNALFVAGKNYEAISMMSLLNYSGFHTFLKREAEYYFPAAYGQEILRTAREEELDPIILFALVRSESAFKEVAKSTAGAVGLTQLMPETAAEIGKQIGLPDPDIKNPEVNLKIGAHYIARLITRLENIPQAFMAYNAGLTTIRRWQKSYGDLPLDLFIEAVPYNETRNYIYIALTSSVMYGELYFNANYKKVIPMFYPGL